MHIMISSIPIKYKKYLAQLARVVEYFDCILSRRIRTSPMVCAGYNIKQSDGGAPVILGLWRMRSTPSLPLLPGSLWTGMVAAGRVLSMGRIELFDI